MPGEPISAAVMPQVVRDATTEPALTAILEDPRFNAVAFDLVEAWAPQLDDDADLRHKLRDSGTFLAAIWALQLSSEPTGLSAATLGALLQTTGYGSRNRAIALLTYLRFLRLIEPLPAGVDGRNRRDQLFSPTAPLRQLMLARFRRDLSLARPLAPSAGPCLERWEEPGIADAYANSIGLYTTASLLLHDRDRPMLDELSNRNAGMTVLGQLVTEPADRGSFPPAGPARLNVAEIARRTGASRHQVRALLRIGGQAGFLREAGDGLVHFTDELRVQLRGLMAFQIIGLEWAARRAVSGDVTAVA